MGYYVVRGEWFQFARTGEFLVCDACMWLDPKYRLIYGVHV